MRICGIDPGKQGAVAIFGNGPIPQNCDSLVTTMDSDAFIGVWDMPLTAEKDVDTVALANILSSVGAEIIVELQQPHGVQTSRVAIWENGYQYRGVIEACRGMKYREVRPAEWMRSLGCIAPKGMAQKDKKLIHCELAARMFPDIQLRGPKGGWYDGRAEALLIAEYGRRILAR